MWRRWTEESTSSETCKFAAWKQERKQDTSCFRTNFKIFIQECSPIWKAKMSPIKSSWLLRSPKAGESSFQNCKTQLRLGCSKNMNLISGRKARNPLHQSTIFVISNPATARQRSWACRTSWSTWNRSFILTRSSLSITARERSRQSPWMPTWGVKSVVTVWRRGILWRLSTDRVARICQCWLRSQGFRSARWH